MHGFDVSLSAVLHLFPPNATSTILTPLPAHLAFLLLATRKWLKRRRVVESNLQEVFLRNDKHPYLPLTMPYNLDRLQLSAVNDIVSCAVQTPFRSPESSRKLLYLDCLLAKKA